ncbi:MAG: hypothetical protein IJM81_05250 [Prevotella sp.]|nr:hypothetical protein [Prevotella sp.]
MKYKNWIRFGFASAFQGAKGHVLRGERIGFAGVKGAFGGFWQQAKDLSLRGKRLCGFKQNGFRFQANPRL